MQYKIMKVDTVFKFMFGFLIFIMMESCSCTKCFQYRGGTIQL
jgi:hypothetical protein